MKDSDIKKENLTQTASKSVFWTAFGNVGVSAIRFFTTAILARILMPEEFGIVGMALLFTGIVQLFGNIGLGYALIQRKGIDDEYKSTCFWAGLGVGFFLMCITILIAPLSALYFKEPQVENVIRLLSITFLLSAMAGVHVTLLVKALKFKNIAIIEIICMVVRISVVLTLGLKGFSYWSIVVGILVERVLKTILLISQVKWMPKWIFHKDKFKELFNFGRNVYAQSFLGYLNSNMDFLVTGRLLGAANMAFYQFAYNLPNLALTLVSQSVEQVTFPLYSKIQSDPKRVFRGYLKTCKLISLLTFPILFGLSFTADNFIIVVYGDQWGNAIAPLRILCFSSAFNSVSTIKGSILRAIGRPDVAVKWQAFKLPLTVGAIIFGSQFGLLGIAWAMFTMVFLDVIIIGILVKMIQGNLLTFFLNLKNAFMSSVLMWCALKFINKYIFSINMNNFVNLILDVFCGGIIYVLVLWLFFRNDFNEFANFIGNIFSKIK